MLFLIPKLLLLVGLPIAITVYWQRRTHAHRSILIFACGAFAVNYLLQRLLTLFISPLLEAIPMNLVASMGGGGLYAFWITRSLILGLLREGVRWLVLRYKATNVRSWQDGVMFGIAYGCIATLMLVGTSIFDVLTEMGLFKSTLELLVENRSRLGFGEIVMALNDRYFWITTLFLTWEWGVSLMIFNVGTCLAVVFSVQRRAVLPFLAAVVLYVVFTNSRLVVMQSSFLGQTIDLPFFYLPPPFTSIFFFGLGTFISALPCLGLIFLLRKPMNR